MNNHLGEAFMKNRIIVKKNRLQRSAQERSARYNEQKMLRIKVDKSTITFYT